MLLFKNLTNRKIRCSKPRIQKQELLLVNRSLNNSPELTSTIDDSIEAEVESNQLNLDIEEKLTLTIQQILVPTFFSLLTTVCTYIVIGMLSNIDALRYYSYFLGKIKYFTTPKTFCFNI